MIISKCIREVNVTGRDFPGIPNGIDRPIEMGELEMYHGLEHWSDYENLVYYFNVNYLSLVTPTHNTTWDR